MDKLKRLHTGVTNPMELGMLPPQEPLLEEAVLGALMVEKKAFAVVASLLGVDDFYVDANSRIFNAISILNRSGKPTDFMSVITQLKSTNELDIVGGAYEITKRTNAASVSYDYHAKVILEKSMLRKQILINREFERKCYQSDADPFELLSEQRLSLSKIERYDNDDFSPVSRMKETMDAIYKAKANDGVAGVPLGIKKLTAFLGGASGGDYYVFAARSGSFKSALMIWIQHHLDQLNVPSLMFQQEMTNAQTGLRELAIKSGLDTQNIKTARLSEDDWIKVHKANGLICNSKVYIDTTPNQKISTMKSKMQRAIDEFGIKVAVVDYLHLSDLEVKKHGGDEAAISAHAKEMKAIAKELNIAIFELAQFNREATKDETKPPHIGMLKGSGAIEYCADGVILLWYPAGVVGIEPNFEYEGVDVKEKIMIILAKNKNGEKGQFWHGVKASNNDFFELDDNDYEPNKHIEPNSDFDNEEKPNILTK